MYEEEQKEASSASKTSKYIKNTQSFSSLSEEESWTGRDRDRLCGEHKWMETQAASEVST